MAFSVTIWPHCTSSRCTQLVMEKIQNRVREEKKNCSSIPAIFLYTAMMNQSPELGREFWHPLTLQAEPTRYSSGESWIQVDFHEIGIFFRHDSFPAGSVDSTVALWFIGILCLNPAIAEWTRFLSLHQPATRNLKI